MMMLMGILFMIPLIWNYWLFLMSLFILSFMFSLKLNYMEIMSNLSYFFGMDSVSYGLILLSFWICAMMVLASGKLYQLDYYWELFLALLLLLLVSLYLTFMSMNLFIFYLFFEMSLIPTLLLILGWGNQPERLMAGMYLMFYTLLMSLPMLVTIFFLYSKLWSLDYYYLNMMDFSIFTYLGFNFIFFVKIPMFLLHLWLPKAHVEAPISGSMILAGVLLKLGGYGLLRTMKLFLDIAISVNFFFIIISLIGGVIVSLICVRQSDLKMLIAYSSVSHMGLVLAGVLSLNILGVMGAVILMIAHGLCSSGLFCLANIIYERTNSRSIYINKGCMNYMPNLTLWWFMLCACNMSAPPSLNLVGEILLILSLSMYSKLTLMVIFILVFYSAVYSLFLYSYTQHGKIFSGVYSVSQIFFREYLLLFLHWFPLNVFILKLNLLI